MITETNKFIDTLWSATTCEYCGARHNRQFCPNCHVARKSGDIMELRVQRLSGLDDIISHYLKVYGTDIKYSIGQTITVEYLAFKFFEIVGKEYYDIFESIKSKWIYYSGGRKGTIRALQLARIITHDKANILMRCSSDSDIIGVETGMTFTIKSYWPILLYWMRMLLTVIISIEAKATNIFTEELK